MSSVALFVFASLAPIAGYFFMRARNPTPFIPMLTAISHIVVATFFLVYAADSGLALRGGIYGALAMLYLIFAYLHWRVGATPKEQ